MLAIKKIDPPQAGKGKTKKNIGQKGKNIKV
jgi:hypothetical protein